MPLQTTLGDRWGVDVEMIWSDDGIVLREGAWEVADQEGTLDVRLGPVTEAPARILGLEGYGIAPGCKADFVLLDAAGPVEAIRLRAARRAVVRRGHPRPWRTTRTTTMTSPTAAVCHGIAAALAMPK